MKQKTNARERREEEALRRKQVLSTKTTRPKKTASQTNSVPSAAFHRQDMLPVRSPEEEVREFLKYLERYDMPVEKEEPTYAAKKKPTGSVIPRLNLEEGMPIVSEALDRMHMDLQEMRHSQVKVVKLIHGYGSTGRGGKICIGVRAELAVMKRRGQIKDFIPGEDFGPMDMASRNLVERDRSTCKDPDYGRINHGITIVIL